MWQKAIVIEGTPEQINLIVWVIPYDGCVISNVVTDDILPRSIFDAQGVIAFDPRQLGFLPKQAIGPKVVKHEDWVLGIHGGPKSAFWQKARIKQNVDPNFHFQPLAGLPFWVLRDTDEIRHAHYQTNILCSIPEGLDLVFFPTSVVEFLDECREQVEHIPFDLWVSRGKKERERKESERKPWQFI